MDNAKESTILWYANLKATNNANVIPLFFDKHRYLVMKGGGGSGKSIFAGRKVLERATTEPGHRVLVCRKVQRTLRESCFEQLRGQISDYYPKSGAKVNKTDMSITFQNGSKIIFAGLDDVEKLKSIYDITMIWIEEASELEEGDFNQLDIRLRTDFPYYLQMILTFNPISITHWLKKRFFDYRDERARVHESTYLDNRFLTPEAIRTLETFKETDEYYYQVYCLGQWGVTGKTVFNARALGERLQQLPKPKAEGFFDITMDGAGRKVLSYQWQDEKDSAIKIYKQPEPGRPYIIGGDTAGEGSDWFIAQVLDNITGEQVAILRHHYDEDTYARQVYALSKFYNDALCAIEVNASTYPVKCLEQMGAKQYVRESEDTFTGSIKKAFGFRTDRLTRPVIIAELIKVMREDPALVNDRTTVEEMLTFIRTESLRPEAEPGAHDDTVMALAIAHYCRPQQSMILENAAGTKKKKTWSEDMLHDYWNATPLQQAEMEKMWGTPD